MGYKAKRWGMRLGDVAAPDFSDLDLWSPATSAASCRASIDLSFASGSLGIASDVCFLEPDCKRKAWNRSWLRYDGFGGIFTESVVERGVLGQSATLVTAVVLQRP
ncbi:hypothetical protein BDW22DRAFT_1358285 [Trametopsis cervina]|nr:hypothetical protein BDW22DRAFT_1358285 [Trametopsis cervina]